MIQNLAIVVGIVVSLGASLIYLLLKTAPVKQNATYSTDNANNK